MAVTASDRAPLDVAAASAMLVLSVCWGFQQVAIKLAAPSVPLLAQASIRSALAAVLLLAWARLRGVPLLQRDGTLLAGVVAGLAFAGEFALIYAGLAYTSAARMIVFLYTAPCLTALGLALVVPGERLSAWGWAGVALAFAGILLGFAERSGAAGTRAIGDAFGVGAAVLWAATTVLVRGSALARASATKVLFYQLAVSALLLPLASYALAEPRIQEVSALALASLLFQSVVVAFASYLAWFWLLTRYLATRLAVFSFLTPLFGVVFGTFILHEPLSPAFLAAFVLVALGIAIVNARR